MKKLLFLTTTLAFLAFLQGLASAGEFHSGATSLCADCHTMHSSQSHGWADGTVSTGPTPPPTNMQDWLPSSTQTAPVDFLLKAPSNLLCLSCHDGQTFAPDVLGFNANASPIQGRNAGALNDTAGASPYQTWKGHTLDSTAVAPGFNPTVIGAPATWYDPTAGLTCISCHAHHGPVAAYRNLGPTALGSAITDARPTYIISSTNDTLRDVWINLPSYIAGSGSATTFNPFYATVYINYNRNDATVNITRTSNRVDTFCAACHGNFHGGPGDTNIGGTGTPAIGFLRHPTSQATIGFATGGAHSVLSLYVAATSKVKVYTNDYAAYSSSSPGCVSCHKAHGNQNPFGLIFLSRAEANPNEEGSTVTDFTVGYRNLCGQCHP